MNMRNRLGREDERGPKIWAWVPNELKIPIQILWLLLKIIRRNLSLKTDIANFPMIMFMQGQYNVTLSLVYALVMQIKLPH